MLLSTYFENTSSLIIKSDSVGILLSSLPFDNWAETIILIFFMI